MNINCPIKAESSTCDLSPRMVGIFGLVISSFGSIVLALALTAGDGHQTSLFSGIDYHVALISNLGFKVGFFLMILGFVFQITERVKESDKRNVETTLLVSIFISSLVVYILGISVITRILFT